MTATLRCLVVDDEPLAREGIANYVQQIDFLHLQASCASAVEAANQLARTPADLLFLDIEMPQLSGIDFLSRCRTRPWSFLLPPTLSLRSKVTSSMC